MDNTLILLFYRMHIVVYYQW